MTLAEFLVRQQEGILLEFEQFAATLLPAAQHMNVAELRDHGAQILSAIVADLGNAQSVGEELQKSQGLAPRLSEDETAAEAHGTLRATDGFDIRQAAAEYRALRASVTRLWLAQLKSPTPADLYELVRFNEAIDQALAESVDRFARETSRLRNLFLGVLSHELRTPLNTVKAAGHALLLATEQGRSAPAGLGERVVRAARRMGSLVDNLLEHVRSGSGGGLRIQPAPADMGEICERLIRDLTLLYPSRHIELRLASGLQGEWDAERVAQAISNLVSNAMKYGDQEAPVTVSVDLEGNEAVAIKVHNIGAPVEADLLRRLFRPLVRGAREDKTGYSLGLGLYVVKEIVEGHGGQVSVESSDVAGTTFKITLPIRSQHAPSSAFAELRMN